MHSYYVLSNTQNSGKNIADFKCIAIDHSVGDH